MHEHSSIYQSLGEEKIRQLVRHFYKNVEKAPALRKLYPEDLLPAEERLYWFLLHVFGGPSPYLEKRGHPMLRKRHFQWEIDGALRDLWLNCMFHAIDQTQIDPSAREAMMAYFVNAANHLINK